MSHPRLLPQPVGTFTKVLEEVLGRTSVQIPIAVEADCRHTGNMICAEAYANRTAGLNVLVVDDDPAVRTMMRIAFSVEEGIGDVREAGSGREVMELCSEFAPDLVMLDFWMPEMNGAQVAEWLRSAHPDVRIVAFSGVLERKPDWADDICVKGRMPNLDVVIDLTRRERRG